MSNKVSLKTLFFSLQLDEETALKVRDIAVKNIVQLKGLQNHRYSKAINELMNQDERYKLLELLFAVAASDGNADQLESEEIRVVTKELKLEHQHYISARASGAKAPRRLEEKLRSLICYFIVPLILCPSMFVV